MCIEDINIIGGVIDTISGGTKFLTVSGGFSKKLKHKEHKIVIGNETKNFINNRMLEWDSFKSTFYTNGKLDPKYYDKFLNALNSIFIMPFFTVSENEILYFINNIYKAKPSEIFNGLQKVIPVNNTIKSAIRHLFMVYKIYIEKTIELYVSLRGKYITDKHLSAKNKENNFAEMLEKWHLIDSKNSIDTSSTILYFNFPPPDIEFEKTIPKIEWGIKGCAVKLDASIKKFLNKIKATKFNYIGFCPHVAIARFKLLLDFPIDELSEMITEMDPKYNKKNECQKIVKKIGKITESYKNISQNDIHISRVKVDDISSFGKKMSVEKKIKCFEKYIAAFLKMYKDLIPHMAKKEKAINNIAISINDIASDISIL